MNSSAVFTNISELGVAAQKNDSKLMISLVGEKGCDVNYNGTFLRYSEEYPIVAWQTPLHIASTRGNEGEKAKVDFLVKLLLILAAVSVLLSYPETAVNPQDELGVTPLYAAASWGHSDLVETLFQAEWSFPCMEATYPYAIKTQRKAGNAPSRELWVT